MYYRTTDNQRQEITQATSSHAEEREKIMLQEKETQATSQDEQKKRLRMEDCSFEELKDAGIEFSL